MTTAFAVLTIALARLARIPDPLPVFFTPDLEVPSKIEGIADAFGTVKDVIFTSTLGCFFVVGYLYRDGMRKNTVLVVADTISVLMFFMLSVLTMFFLYKSSFGFFAQTATGNLDYQLIEPALSRSAQCLFGMALAVILMAGLRLFGRPSSKSDQSENLDV